ncbi:uncharacterized protein PAC_12054 [Phialocephala subalpina]|uniref:CorA-like transporter domain-containing protein n=1 Tax=Phialocephala subalpina TaxID=576137 RepID=A0A1L7XB03_9HELO|nr:uncharacterized protein PAC_12054 [Phialocephala subalpina]
MSIPSDTELLRKSCLEAFDFPKNVVRTSTPQHHLNTYRVRLAAEIDTFNNSDRLFCEDGKAALDIWEYDDNGEEFQPTCASSIFELKGRLEGTSLYSHDDPRCRFLFISAPHSRARLRISRQMMLAALTHHQVMPSFLDFIFPFGNQEYLQDFYFSGLREETRLQSPAEGLVIPQLGRSGREVRMCYNLKSVETSDGNPEWPWSIRQTAVYHSFDVETGKAFWITVKGSQLIKNRIQEATAKGAVRQTELKSFDSNLKAFASTLATHLVLADWCVEEWRWYLNFLEKRLQDTTGRALAIIIEREPSIFNEPIRQQTSQPSSPSILRTMSNFTKRTLSRGTRDTKSSSDLTGLEKVPFKPSFPQPTSPFDSPPPPPCPPPPPIIPPGMPGAPITESHSEEKDDFTFKNLQLVQHFEDKANEIAPVLEANIDILTELKEHYQSIMSSDDCPDDIKSCKKEFAHFEKRISSVITDLRRQRSRTQLLSRLLSDRKGLLYGILNKRAIETSKALGKRAQFTAERMEKVNDSMHEIAKKTQQETVSMKIITLVTLFFLPGTFISTIMSTDILQFQDNSENYQSKALEYYLMITIPIMAVTFGVWWGMYWWVKRGEQKKENEQHAGTLSILEKGQFAHYMGGGIKF